MTDTRVALTPTLGERMKMALAYSGKSVNEMAAHLEVTRASASRWISGTHSVKGLVLREWAETTGVNEQWLRTGEVPAEATIVESCARRDSNPQPSDPWAGWEFESLRTHLFAFGISLDLEPEELRDYLAFLDEIAPVSIAHIRSSQAGMAALRYAPRSAFSRQESPDTEIANVMGVA